jgi:hypothetical protein
MAKLSGYRILYVEDEALIALAIAGAARVAFTWSLRVRNCYRRCLLIAHRMNAIRITIAISIAPVNMFASLPWKSRRLATSNDQDMAIRIVPH